jgi:DNA-binding MarR family transcriptional regulator
VVQPRLFFHAASDRFAGRLKKQLADFERWQIYLSTQASIQYQLTSMTNTSTSATTDFCLRLARAATVLTRRFDAPLGGHHGISFADYQLLKHLARAPGGRLRRVDLAERLGLTASGVTRSLLPLEKIGLVSRQSDPRDARVGYASLTASGSELVGNAESVVDAVSRELLAGADPDQLGALTALLGRIAGIHGANA